ncbi:hypothetical protein [uncultured Mucilaginibacter sp.]|uniref:hypothetical protein n=1 Tax=uncultured Mucilaginibacter sp. TaxID=797541 RepID=UPI0025F3AD72|nr:hypothetical protein [uncultured Mucilaginibacter sp.]
MKLLIVTCVKECKNDVYKIFKQANINVFSATDLVGFKNNQTFNIAEEWFARGDEKFDSLMVFSFTADENAERGLELFNNYNETNQPDFPIRAFMLPVEKFI